MSVKPKVYLETTVISYLTAAPSRDIVQVAHQQITREWWDRRKDFDLFVSQAVITEAGRGDSAAAARRLATLEDVSVLEVTEDASRLAEAFIEQHALPAKAAVDALHIAVAVVMGMDYVLTWNCTHIANAAIRPRIEDACRKLGYEAPVICTPEELMG
jgi:predicted nucleic acid-binding protein